MSDIIAQYLQLAVTIIAAVFTALGLVLVHTNKMRGRAENAYIAAVLFTIAMIVALVLYFDVPMGGY